MVVNYKYVYRCLHCDYHTEMVTDKLNPVLPDDVERHFSEQHSTTRGSGPGYETRSHYLIHRNRDYRT